MIVTNATRFVSQANAIVFNATENMFLVFIYGLLSSYDTRQTNGNTEAMRNGS